MTGVYAPEDLVGLGNSWGAVQTYYACYHATQSMVIARGQARPASHRKTQTLYVDHWVTPKRRLGAWSLGAAEGGYRNLPDGKLVDEQIHPWTTCDHKTCWDIVCKAYRTTGTEVIEDELQRERDRKTKNRRRDWEIEEAGRLSASKRPRKTPVFRRANLTAAERMQVAGRVRAQGLLDYLYRLRMKAQYEDATMFTDGPDAPSESVQVYKSLRRITAATLLLHELWIKQIVGEQLLMRLVEEWLSESSFASNPLAARHHILAG